MTLRWLSTRQVVAREANVLTHVRPREIAALTGLRGVAAFWVVALHVSLPLNPIGPSESAFDRIGHSGYLGVDLFFVLSGFVIADNYRQFFQSWDFSTYWRFLFVRFGRLYPVHFVTLLVTLAAVLLAAGIGRPPTTGGVDYSPLAFAANILLVQAWGWPQLSWNPVAWTISAEWFAYLTFPFVAGTIFARLVSRAALGLTVILGYSVMLAVLAWVGFSAASSQLGLVRVAAGFSSGVVVWLWARNYPLSDKASGLVTVIGIAGLFVTILLMSPIALAEQALWPVPWFVLLVLGVASDRGPIARLLSTPPAIYLGRVSYSLYMVHVWVIFASRMILGSELGIPPRGVVVSVLATLASIGVATFMFMVIEEPFRKRSKELVRRKERQVV